MRKGLLTLALVCAAFVVAAPTAIPKTPKQDSVFGSGVRAPSCSEGCPAGTFSFNATSGPNGANPSGTFFADFEGYASFTGNVTCLHVSGHTATLVGQISTGTGAADAAGGDPFWYAVVIRDNGSAKPKASSPDQMSLIGWDTEANWANSEVNPPGFTLAQVCADPVGALGDTMFGLVSGDLTVIDK